MSKASARRLSWVRWSGLKDRNVFYCSLDYNGDRNTAEMTKFIKYRMHQFIFKVSEKALKSTAASKWNVNFENFFSKVNTLRHTL